jgi:hypothetical protein
MPDTPSRVDQGLSKKFLEIFQQMKKHSLYKNMKKVREQLPIHNEKQV